VSPEDDRIERMLESGLGAVSDWLELVRAHENERRARLAAEARARKDHLAIIVMVILSTLTVGFFVWLNNR
jgi:hypothetical protein